MHQAILPAAVLAVLCATPARAEKLELDHRLYTPLHQAMEKHGEGTVHFETRPGGGLFDRILVRGESAESNWDEALELLVAPRKPRTLTAQQWYTQFKPSRETKCPAAVSLIEETEAAVTFSVDAPACGAGPGLTGLYKVATGKTTLYLVAAKAKGVMTAEQRRSWLGVLASARVSG